MALIKWKDEEQIQREIRINELKKERAELIQYLLETDYTAIKIAEGVATKEDYADILQQRQAARNRINEIDIILGGE